MNHIVIFLIMTALYGILLGFFLNAVSKVNYKEKYVPWKSIQSAGFLAAFFISSIIYGDPGNFCVMLPAFICCFMGDVFLAFYNKYKKRRIFTFGLLAFLAGHIFFIRWFAQIQPIDIADFIVPLLGVGITYYLTTGKIFHTGRLRPFVLIYAFFVTFLAEKGVRIALAFHSAAHFLSGIGSVLFLVSDISILFLYFWRKRNKKIHLFNLYTYYAGIYLLASCTLFV